MSTICQACEKHPAAFELKHGETTRHWRCLGCFRDMVRDGPVIVVGVAGRKAATSHVVPLVALAKLARDVLALVKGGAEHMTYDELRAAHPMMRRAMDMQGELQHGQRVRVLWDGGNGPHEYEVSKLDGLSWAVIRQRGEPYYVGELSGLHLVEVIGGPIHG